MRMYIYLSLCVITSIQSPPLVKRSGGIPVPAESGWVSSCQCHRSRMGKEKRVHGPEGRVEGSDEVDIRGGS